MQQVLTMIEAANYLRLNYCTLSRKVKNGEIPAFRIGAKILFRLNSLEKWIEAQEHSDLTQASTETGILRRVKE